MKESQNKILPHSQAKLNLYQKYLEKYLSILGLAEGITSINLFDLFCGAGIYEDGKFGSPILAIEKIKENRRLFRMNEWSIKPIKLFLNDRDSQKVKNIGRFISNEKLPDDFELEFQNSDVEEIFTSVVKTFEYQDTSERNLLFIDPYGYKTINPDIIQRLLQNNRTEIFLFLPVSFMHRFKNIALIDGRECYKALNEFVTSLFPENHPMTKPSDLSIHEFIEYITEGFSFDGNNYCVSHSIERSKNNFFAVFFMTSHIYGLERILEVKWKEDEEFGKSFRLDTNSPQLSLFEKWDKEQNKTSNIQKLSNILLELMSTSNKLDNLVLYEETLKNGFLPKHSNQVLRELKKKNSIRILDSTTGEEINSTKALYNNWNTYKNHESKIIIEKT